LNKPDPLRPLLGAGLFAFGYYIVLNLAATVAQFLGRAMVAQTVPPLIAATAMGALAMAIFESRTLSDSGLHWRAGSERNLGTGVLIGVGGALLLIVPAIIFRMAHFTTVPGAEVSWRSVLFTLGLLLCGAAGEEIAFRGFPLQFLIRGYGPWISVTGIGALFGLLHGFNPGATPLSIANTAGFGVLFGVALLRSHDLWFPIGMHFGWNATLPFLGVELSGFTIKVTGYQLVWTSGDLWSGGNYGPEASLLASLVLLILFLVVWKVPVRKGWAYLLDYSPQAE
jgi:membrane protease YdiL (CAAX protease family)